MSVPEKKFSDEAGSPATATFPCLPRPRGPGLARAHVLEGLEIALDHLDEVIALIRAAEDAATARTQLMERFELSERQEVQRGHEEPEPAREGERMQMDQRFPDRRRPEE